jgi:hypothetical protein
MSIKGRGRMRDHKEWTTCMRMLYNISENNASGNDVKEKESCKEGE